MLFLTDRREVHICYAYEAIRDYICAVTDTYDPTVASREGRDNGVARSTEWIDHRIGDPISQQFIRQDRMMQEGERIAGGRYTQITSRSQRWL